MAGTFTPIDKVSRRLGREGKGKTNPQILGYNPTINMSHTTSAPYTLTILEDTQYLTLKTIITYDKVYPTGNVISITKQTIDRLDPLPEKDC